MEEEAMKRLLGVGLLLVAFTLPAFAAKNSQVFQLVSDVKVGDATLPQGLCEVTWTDVAGEKVELSIKTKDKKIITASAKVAAGKPATSGVLTFDVGGVKHLKGFNTKEHSFIVLETAPAK
jgi:hypothetical protein